jgi:hypothetical protein
LGIALGSMYALGITSNLLIWFDLI